jgi:predicted tellurium resistance membrane protein TerC
MIALLTNPNAWAALATLTALEIVLRIDNIVFISILGSRCAPDQALRARQVGLSLAFVFRIVMLFGLTWLIPCFPSSVSEFDFHIPRGYIYFAMAFAAAVETFNVLARRRRHLPTA